MPAAPDFLGNSHISQCLVLICAEERNLEIWQLWVLWALRSDKEGESRPIKDARPRVEGPAPVQAKAARTEGVPIEALLGSCVCFLVGYGPAGYYLTQRNTSRRTNSKHDPVPTELQPSIRCSLRKTCRVAVSPMQRA